MAPDKKAVEADRQHAIRAFVAYMISFFLIISLLTAFFVIPHFNKSFEAQNIADRRLTLDIETEMLERAIEKYRGILQDLSNFPVVSSTLMLSEPNDPDFVDFLGNTYIAGERARIIIHDIIGDPFYQTAKNIKGNFESESQWLQQLLSGEKAYHFQLVEKEGDSIKFVTSVPVKHHGNIEGIMSAEILIPLNSVFSKQTLSQGAAFRLQQGAIDIQSDTSHIEIPFELSKDIEKEDIKITYISDFSDIIQEQNELANTILVILFAGLGISFFAFAALGYKTYTEDEEKGKAQEGVFNKNYVVPLIIGLIGISASVSGSMLLQNIQRQNKSIEVQTRNATYMKDIGAKIESNMEILEGMKIFYESSEWVSADEFSTYTNRILKSQSDVMALAWAPKIQASERQAFEEKMRAEGNPDFEIKDIDANLNLIPAQEHAYYYPIAYAEVGGEAKVPFGANLGSHPERLDVLVRAEQNDAAVASLPIRSLTTSIEGADETQLLIARNVDKFAGGQQKETAGYVYLILDTQRFVSNALSGNYEKVDIVVQDVTDRENPVTVFASGDKPAIESPYVTERTSMIAGRQWKFSIAPKDVEENGIVGIVAAAILWGGIIFSVFISYTFIQLVRRHEIIEGIVEQRTREVQELSSAMENAVEGVSQMNPEGDYVYMNEAYASVCGYKVEELIGKPWSAILHPDDYPLMEEAYNTMLEKGKGIEEPRGIRKGGSVFYMRVTLIGKYDERNEFVGYHCFMSDISDRKRSENELRQANEELEEFAYRTSHDLRSPLVSSIGLLGLARKSLHSGNTEKALKSIDHIEESLTKLEALVKDILSLTQMKNAEEEEVDIDVGELVSESLNKLAHMENFSRLDIRKDLRFDEPLRLKKSRFSLIIENFLSNAVKYQDVGEEKSYVKLSTYKSGTDFVFEIEDNGLGIPKQQQENLFKMFKRFHKVAFGSGLGLYMMKKSADILGARIVFEDPGKGTRFKLIVPLVKEEQ